MTSSTERERLLELLSSQADDRLEAQEYEELQRLLQSSQDLRAVMIRHALMQGLMVREAAGMRARLTVAPVPARASGGSEVGWLRRINRPPVFAAAFAASFLFAALTLLAMWRVSTMERPDDAPQVTRRAASTPPPVIARVDWAASVTAEPRPSDVSTSRGLAAGQPVEIAEGELHLQFASGARVKLIGPARFAPQTAQGGFLHFGRLQAQIETREARGFTIETAAARIVDWGTEFGVSVGEQGFTEVHVFVGRVVAIPASDPLVRVQLTQEQAAHFPLDGPPLTGLPAEAAHFAARTMQRSGPATGARVTTSLVALPLAEIVPGSERVRLAPNGDFEQTGPPEPNGEFPLPSLWQRQEHMFVGPLGPEFNLPAGCGASHARATIDARTPVGIYQQAVRLEAETRYVLSGYLWNLGDAHHRLRANVDLNDVPGEPCLALPSDAPGGSEGYFMYQEFDTRETGTEVLLRVFYDDYQAFDDLWPAYPLGAIWDNIAITRKDEFQPPARRTAAEPQP